MRDSVFDGGEGVGRGHWYVHPAGCDHRRCLRDCWRNFGRNFRVAQPKAPHRERLEDDVQRADGHRSLTHRRKADERAVGRERRCEHARRRAADAIKRQAELGLTDSRFDPFRDIRRIDDDNVSAERLELGYEFGAPDDVDGLQATRFRKGDHPPPDTGIGGVLHDPFARLQVDILAEQQRRGRGI